MHQPGIVGDRRARGADQVHRIGQFGAPTQVVNTRAGRDVCNPTVVEAAAYAHDLGHPPFGHTGEEALSDILEERTGRRFRHNEHSLRMVERLERDGRGRVASVVLAYGGMAERMRRAEEAERREKAANSRPRKRGAA